jgi:hypothetical protein
MEIVKKLVDSSEFAPHKEGGSVVVNNHVLTDEIEKAKNTILTAPIKKI